MKSKRKIKELEREIDELKDYIKVSREYDSLKWAERNTIEVNKKFKIKRLLIILIANVERRYLAYIDNGCDEYYSDLSYKIDEIIKKILEVK